MQDKETSRLSRLSSILTMLQSKRLLTASAISKKFDISIRTVYRDIRALEQSGIPVCTEEGRGYSLMEGFTLPPVMFTETEANALITAAHLVAKNKDQSLVKNYTEAITKIKAVLKYNTKDKAALLSERIQMRVMGEEFSTSNNLSDIQLAITNFKILTINYTSLSKDEQTSRQIAPLALYMTQENWVLIAWCYLRKDHRAFRLDKIMSMQTTAETHSMQDFNLQDFFEACRKKHISPLT